MDMATRQNRFVSADTILPHSSGSEIGCDGMSSTGELRPKYKPCPFEHFAEIRKIIKNKLPAMINLANYQMFAGSGRFTSNGGHIHLGVPVNATLIRNLDTHLYTPLNTISNTSNRGSYNRPGQYEPKPWGFEYRSCCSWLTTPKLTLGSLVIAYILAKKWYGKPVTREMLMAEANRKSGRVAKAINEFYGEIERIRTEGKVLEEIEVFSSWGKKAPKAGVMKYNIRFNINDFNMREIFGTPAQSLMENLYFVGANRENWTGVKVILPRTMRHIRIDGIEIVYWDFSYIGLSYELRQDITKSKSTVKELIKQIDRKIKTERRAS
jgi:hypothetical protein